MTNLMHYPIENLFVFPRWRAGLECFNLITQGLVTYISSVEVFVIRIKTVLSDQSPFSEAIKGQSHFQTARINSQGYAAAN